MGSLSVLKTFFSLPIAVLALLIPFRYKIYTETLEYCDEIDNFVTADIEQTTAVSSEDVYDWAWSLRRAWLYRKFSRGTMFCGYGSLMSWFLAVILSKFDPFGLGSWQVPVVGIETAIMAQNFAIGLLAAVVSLVMLLFYMDHKRKDGGK